MKLVLKTAPAVEPVSLSELKIHLRTDSLDFDDAIDTTQSIAPGAHAAGSGYSYTGASVQVLGYQAIVNLDSGTNQATGTVDIKIQESDDNATWTDWTGGAFTQVTTANDNAVYEKAYTGTKAYIRVLGKVSNASCDFSVTIIRLSAVMTEDSLLSEFITSAREDIESATRRALITQTWYAYLDRFPAKDYIQLPFGNLQSVTSIKYKDSAGTETTMTVTTDYLVETNGDQHGRIVLPYQGSWPSAELYPSNPITIEFVCGYGLAVAVPSRLKTAIKMIAADLWVNREAQVMATQGKYEINERVENMIRRFRLWGEF